MWASLSTCGAKNGLSPICQYRKPAYSPAISAMMSQSIRASGIILTSQKGSPTLSNGHSAVLRSEDRTQSHGERLCLPILWEPSGHSEALHHDGFRHAIALKIFVGREHQADRFPGAGGGIRTHEGLRHGITHPRLALEASSLTLPLEMGS